MRQPSLVACAALGVASFACQAPAETPVAADLYPFVSAIAAPTASARIGGSDQRFQKVVTIGRNSEGIVVVTGIQVVPPTRHPAVSRGAAAIYIAHFEGQCAAPFGNDDYPTTLGVATFVGSPSGRFVWELGTADGRASIRLVDAKGPAGPWEPFQKDPTLYRAYACEKYAG